MTVGTYNSCAAHADASTVTCWLYPFDATHELSSSFNLEGVQSIAMAGDNFRACAVIADGTVRCWGSADTATGTTEQVVGLDLF